MDVKIKTFRSLPCETEVFQINGVDADLSDFGSMYDVDIESAGPWECGCREFVAYDTFIQQAMQKYGITSDEFSAIQEMLKSEMHVGHCSWCV